MLLEFLAEETASLLAWFDQNRRTLPWREDPAPYRVWISEIMLQQTRVQAVIPYFERFMRELPGVEDLAVCEDDRLLKLWEGLGYYNRARNLKKASQIIVQDYAGKLPEDYESLIKLPGIGAYTAGAILSIACKKPYPAVDGNVLRVLTRLSADPEEIGRSSLRKKIENALNPQYLLHDPSKLTQALMELGAAVCLPNGAPKCADCPWQNGCLAHRAGEEERYPVKTKPKPRRKEKKTILLIRDGERFVLRKRPEKGLLAGLYELPSLTGYASEEEALGAVKKLGFAPLRIEKLEPASHLFSHVEWDMIGYLIRIEETEIAPEGLFLVEIEESRKQYSVPSAFRYYLGFLQKRNR